MLELKKRTLKVKYEGEAFEMSYPTQKQVVEYSDKAEGKEGKAAAVVLEGFLVDLGMPKSVYEQLEVDHVQQIVSEVTGSKKK